MESVWAVTPVIIVSYRTPSDLAACLTSLDSMQAEPAFSVHICENGGAAAFDDLCQTLLRPDGPCTAAEDESFLFEGAFNRIRCLRLHKSNRPVLVGEASANLGYAGGINAWLSPLLRLADWGACWILNPDTVVAPDALSALAAHAANRKLGMVGSRVVATPAETRITNVGLRWRLIMASGYAVGRGSPASIEPDPAAVEAEIEAANGASCYITRPCAEALAPLDERYFLFFEDLDWGMHARRAGYRIGYAHGSVVIHSGGSSIGSPSREKVGSPLAVYLEFRNSLLFVRTHHRGWFAWTVLMRCLHALRQLRGGRFTPAVRGLLAGLTGETGRPEDQLGRERAPRHQQSNQATGRLTTTRFIKAAISLFWLAALQAYGLLAGRRSSAKLTILYYHAMRTEALPMFRWQLSAIKAYGDVVHPDYLGDSAGRPKIAITFDDGFQSVFESAAPEILAQNIPFTVFVPTARIGGAPSWEMEGACSDHSQILADADTLRAAALKGVRFGAHSRTHPRLTAIAPDLACEEIEGSKTDLERVLGRTIDMFSFPYGDFDERTLRYCKEAGYRFTYSIVPASLDSADGSMLRPRVAVDPSDTKIEFWLKLRGAYSWMKFASAAKSRFRNSVSNFLGRWQQSEREA
jgi:N-acetylglucosaminyl-diphospho-decaprenol L-rhamnosyltransferase